MDQVNKIPGRKVCTNKSMLVSESKSPEQNEKGVLIGNNYSKGCQMVCVNEIQNWSLLEWWMLLYECKPCEQNEKGVNENLKVVGISEWNCRAKYWNLSRKTKKVWYM